MREAGGDGAANIGLAVEDRLNSGEDTLRGLRFHDISPRPSLKSAVSIVDFIVLR